MKLEQVQPAHPQKLYSDKLTSGRLVGKSGGLSPCTVRYLHAILREAMQQALRWDLVVRNIATAVNPPRAERPQFKVWTANESGRFLDVAATDGYTPIWIVAITTGIRRGDLLALRWEDVDLERATVQIRQGLVEIGSRLVFQPPKTKAGRRVVALTPVTVVAFQEHRQWQLAWRDSLGPAWQDLDLVFATSSGGPIARRNRSRRFNELVIRAEVPTIRFHDLRHSHATHLLIDGAHPKIVSERLGHSSIAITLDTYSHVLPDMQRPALAGIDAALFADQKKKYS